MNIYSRAKTKTICLQATTTKTRRSWCIDTNSNELAGAFPTPAPIEKSLITKHDDQQI